MHTGDLVSVTFRNGYDASGAPVLTTLRAEYLGDDGRTLRLGYRDTPTWDGVDYTVLAFAVR